MHFTRIAYRQAHRYVNVDPWFKNSSGNIQNDSTMSKLQGTRNCDEATYNSHE